MEDLPGVGMMGPIGVECKSSSRSLRFCQSLERC